MLSSAACPDESGKFRTVGKRLLFLTALYIMCFCYSAVAQEPPSQTLGSLHVVELKFSE